MKPRWLEHWTQNEILRQDMSLIVGQYDEIRRAHAELADVWLPLKTSDTLVIRYRTWLDEHAADRPDHRGFRTHRRAEPRTAAEAAPFDLPAAHLRQCRDCRRMLETVRRVRRASVVALVLAVPAMVLGGTLVQLVGLAVYLLAAIAVWQATRFARRFRGPADAEGVGGAS